MVGRCLVRNFSTTFDKFLYTLKAGLRAAACRRPSSAGSTTTPGTRNRDAAGRPLVAQGIA
jgi:hypothetical protein